MLSNTSGTLPTSVTLTTSGTNLILSLTNTFSSHVANLYGSIVFDLSVPTSHSYFDPTPSHSDLRASHKGHPRPHDPYSLGASPRNTYRAHKARVKSDMSRNPRRGYKK